MVQISDPLLLRYPITKDINRPIVLKRGYEKLVDDVYFSGVSPQPRPKAKWKVLLALLGAVAAITPPPLNPIWSIPAHCIAQSVVIPKSRSSYTWECEVLDDIASRFVLFKNGPISGEQLGEILPVELIEFPSQEGLKLKGLWIEAQQPSSKTMVLVHGLKMNSLMNAELAKELHSRDSNVLMVDLRAHGGSEGQRINLGLTEGRDIASAIQFLTKNKPKQSESIGLYGHSMGASSILQLPLALKDYPKAMDDVLTHVDRIVLDSPFAFIKMAKVPIVQKYLNTLWLDYINAELQKISESYLGVSLSEINTVTPFNNHPLADKPILLVHGTQDSITPVSHGHYIYGELSKNHPHIEKLILDANHLSNQFAPFHKYDRYLTVVRDPERFERVYEFLDSEKPE